MFITLVIAKLDRSRGGAATWTIELGIWLKQQGHQVHFVANQASEELKQNFPVHLVPRSRDPLKNAERIAQTIETLQADIVHDMGVGTSFDILQSHFGSPTAHDFSCQSLSTLPIRLMRTVTSVWKTRRRNQWFEKQFDASAGRFLAVSPKVAEDLQRHEKIPAENIDTICNGVDADRFHPEAVAEIRQSVRRRFGISPDTFALLTVAHNHRLKGVPTILKSLKRLYDSANPICLMVAGGAKRSPITIGPHEVRFLGNIDEILPVYSAADALAHPTHYDACSLTVLEAMACGLPVITTPNNGASCFVEHGESGLILSNAEDANELATLIESLQCCELRSQMGGHARNTAATWTCEDNFRAIEKLYRDMIVGKKQSAAEPRVSAA